MFKLGGFKRSIDDPCDKASKVRNLYNDYSGSRHRDDDRDRFRESMIQLGFSCYFANRILEELDDRVRFF